MAVTTGKVPRGARPGGGLAGLSCKFENMDDREGLHAGDRRVGAAPAANGNDTLTDPNPEND